MFFSDSKPSEIQWQFLLYKDKGYKNYQLFWHAIKLQQTNIDLSSESVNLSLSWITGQFCENFNSLISFVMLAAQYLAK